VRRRRRQQRAVGVSHRPLDAAHIEVVCATVQEVAGAAQALYDGTLPENATLRQ
jgi:hypothetical protein